MFTNINEFLNFVSNKHKDTTSLYIRRLFRIEKYSYEELYQLSLKFGSFLKKRQILSGDKILIWSQNMPEWTIALLGSLMQGVVVVPVNANNSAKIVEKYCEAVKPKLLLTSHFILEKLENPPFETLFLEELIEMLKDFPADQPDTVDSNQIAEIVFTSGTTGNPKGVVISHKNILSEIEKLIKVFPKCPQYRLLSILPLSHVMEQMVGLFAPLYFGAAIYYLPKLNAVTIRKSFLRYQITHANIVPQLLRLLLDSIEYQAEKEGSINKFNACLKIAPFLPFFLRRILFNRIHANFGGKLSIFGCGSAPLDVKLAKTWENIGIKIIEGYGASETTAALCSNTISDRRFGSVGKPLDGLTIKLSETGEILVKGENITKGYYLNQKATDESFSEDGFFKTGDIGYFDNQGRLYINGREKFKIVTASGDKVYPEDIERELNNNPYVRDSCVFGLKTDQGEIVYASIITKEKGQIDKIIQEVNEKLEPHQKILEYSLWTEKDFPRLASLKIDRSKVRDTIAQSKKNNLSPGLETEKIIQTDHLISLIAKICKKKSADIKEQTVLVKDLELDSLKRVVLISLIEEEFGVEIKEADITNTSTVKELRKIVSEGNKSITQKEYETWPLNHKVVEIREFLRKSLFFPLQSCWVKNIEIKNKDNLLKIPQPSILIFNHTGHYDATLILKILPPNLRKRVVAVADNLLFESKFKAFILYLFGNAYPLNKWGGPVQEGLEMTTSILEKGWSLLIAPEGAISPNGKMLPFKKGTAFLAIETGIPVVPFKVEGYRQVYPRIKNFPYWPEGQGTVTITVGEPLRFKRNISYEDATKQLEEKLTNL